LANQFARYAAQAGIDVYQVIEASNSQPYSHIHQPGIAVGGHCIPVHPRLYLWTDPEATVVSAARAANAGMPDYTIGLLEGAYGDIGGANVVVLGAAYRGGVEVTAFSGVFGGVEALRQCCAVPGVHYPLYSEKERTGIGVTPYQLGERVDTAVVQANHAEYRELGPGDLPGIKAFID